MGVLREQLQPAGGVVEVLVEEGRVGVSVGEDVATGEVFEVAEGLAEGQDVLDDPLIIKWIKSYTMKEINKYYHSILTRYHRIQIRPCYSSPSNTSTSEPSLLLQSLSILQTKFAFSNAFPLPFQECTEPNST